MRYFMKILSLFIGFTPFLYSQKVEDKEKWQRVYLATYPRCGNHWVRSLTEEATHIATGAVYRDKEPMHLKTPFAWGGYAAEHGYGGHCRYPERGDIVLIKTHYPAKPKTPFDLKPAIKTIRIVRHPVASFYSHFLHAGHQLPDDGKLPSWYVEKSIADWRQFETYWNQQSHVFTIRYEDLLSDIHFYFRQLLNEMGYSLTEEEINHAIEKFPPHQGGGVNPLNVYHHNDLRLISKKLKGLMKRYDYTINE
ncbi:MAG: sulfotransferase domain-containing protein [Parachlamydiaceae bacterium]